MQESYSTNTQPSEEQIPRRTPRCRKPTEEAKQTHTPGHHSLTPSTTIQAIVQELATTVNTKMAWQLHKELHQQAKDKESADCSVEVEIPPPI